MQHFSRASHRAALYPFETPDYAGVNPSTCCSPTPERFLTIPTPSPGPVSTVKVAYFLILHFIWIQFMACVMSIMRYLIRRDVI